MALIDTFRTAMDLSAANGEGTVLSCVPVTKTLTNHFC